MVEHSATDPDVEGSTSNPAAALLMEKKSYLIKRSSLSDRAKNFKLLIDSMSIYDFILCNFNTGYGSF